MPKRLGDKEVLRRALARAREDFTAVAPRCRHFGRCGGCAIQDLAYPDQLAAKHTAFRRLRMKAKLNWLFRDIDVAAVASPRPFGYRQRMDFTCAFGAAGLRGRDRRDVIELAECPLTPEPAWRGFTRARDLLRAAGLADYDLDQHHGDLRYLTLRCNRAGEVLLNVVTTDPAHEAVIALLAATLLDEGPVVGVAHLVNAGRTDTSRGRLHARWGRESIEERLLDLRLRIGHDNFFQVNPAVAELAYAQIRDWLIPLRPRLGLDGYSGTGTIAAVLAPACERVIAIDNDPANAEQAQANFATNAITNVDWRLADVERELRALPEPIDVMVLNPPRAGCQPKGVARVLELAPRRIAYMSCNPVSLLRDLQTLGRHYAVAAATVYDMFPQTPHFEVVVCLERR